MASFKYLVSDFNDKNYVDFDPWASTSLTVVRDIQSLFVWRLIVSSSDRLLLRFSIRSSRGIAYISRRSSSY